MWEGTAELIDSVQQLFMFDSWADQFPLVTMQSSKVDVQGCGRLAVRARYICTATYWVGGQPPPPSRADDSP